MNKQMKLIAGIIVLLVIIIGVTATLNKEHVQEKKSLNDDAIFLIKQADEVLKSYTMSEIQALGEVNFKATKNTSNAGPEEHDYRGVLLHDIYKDAGLELTSDDTILNVAADGYAVALDASKVMDSDNVYLTYMIDGEMISTRESGGSGPYMIVVSKDQFSQYWCKYALSTEVQ